MFPKTFVLIILAICFLSACTPSEQVIQTAISETETGWTPVPTQTSFPTIAITVIITKIVTPTFTATPVFTPTITNTPTVTNTRTPTPDPLKITRNDGIYLVGIDIAPGVWKSSGLADDCYWETTTKTGDIINNHFGMAGGTAYIPSSAFQVTFDGCGDWTFLTP